MATAGYHCICMAVSCCAVSNRLSFDTGAGGRGEFCGLGGLGSHEELNIAKGEGSGDCVCSIHIIFSGSEEEEESDPGEV